MLKAIDLRKQNFLKSSDFRSLPFFMSFFSCHFSSKLKKDDDTIKIDVLLFYETINYTLISFPFSLLIYFFWFEL